LTFLIHRNHTVLTTSINECLRDASRQLFLDFAFAAEGQTQFAYEGGNHFFERADCTGYEICCSIVITLF